MDDELVTIVELYTPLDMEMVRGYLESAGIEVFVADEETARIATHLTPIIGGFKIQVRARDADRARELLAEAESTPPTDSAE